MMMGGELHQELKNLCVNTDWKYAAFWKFKHQFPLMLTCEDAYFDNSSKNDRSGTNWFDNMDDNSKDETYAQDLLGLELAKMSYRVYSIGEGTVGNVAANGKHRWIYAHQLVNSFCSSDEHLDVWKLQFTAGIKTIALVPVIPHGVVQLGSLNTITEDLKFVNHIREIFFELQSSLMESTDCSPCVTDLSTSSVKFRKHINNQERTMEKNRSKNKRTAVETINNRQESENPISDFIQSVSFNDQNWNLFMPRSSHGQDLGFETETSESFKFPAGCELFEALGPALFKQASRFDWDTVTTDVTVDAMPGGDLLTQRSDSEHLLEAVVANKPVNSPSNPNGSVCNSFDRLVKVGKKRARPGESRRPRPRDRQLIQDRLKELRQLVPNGSKCSIDSLLERTVKHMMFMQCITKHADKINKCAEFKLLGKETGVRGRSGHEQGSSWAMEIGNNLTLCPIIVENTGVNGQMLVEMVCDECVHFLEMTEVIRSLGLTILKGVTDAYGDKTRMCFVVEGENNRNMHRMDILLSLIQVLQSKTKA